jgi:hypothetical protein
MGELRIAEGRNGLLVATDRTSKFAYVELPEKDTMRIAAESFRTSSVLFLTRSISVQPTIEPTSSTSPGKAEASTTLKKTSKKQRFGARIAVGHRAANKRSRCDHRRIAD